MDAPHEWRRDPSPKVPSDTSPHACRICREEATDDEPLYHPCKCKGSIEYVHQDCLTMSLSHMSSTKKECNLCKAPFTFSKVYDANTPRSLPLPLLFQKLIFHIGRRFLTWCRVIFVFAIWLVALPWAIRLLWRFLFWLADGGWARELHLIQSHIKATADLSANLTTDSIPMTAPSESQPTPSATKSIPFVSIFNRILNVAYSDPAPLTGAARATLFNGTLSSIPYPPWNSLLSDVKFFRHLSDHPTWNRVILDVVEGQIIAISIVVSFVLVFLIREWVVQQLPPAEFADGEHDELLDHAHGVHLDNLDFDWDDHEHGEDEHEHDDEQSIASEQSNHSGYGAEHDQFSSEYEFDDDHTDPGTTSSPEPPPPLPPRHRDHTGPAEYDHSEPGSSYRPRRSSDTSHIDPPSSTADPSRQQHGLAGSDTTGPTIREIVQSLPSPIRCAILDRDDDQLRSCLVDEELMRSKVATKLIFLSVFSLGYNDYSASEPHAVFSSPVVGNYLEDPISVANQTVASLFDLKDKGKDFYDAAQMPDLEPDSLNMMFVNIQPAIDRDGEYPVLSEDHSAGHNPIMFKPIVSNDLESGVDHHSARGLRVAVSGSSAHSAAPQDEPADPSDDERTEPEMNERVDERVDEQGGPATDQPDNDPQQLAAEPRTAFDHIIDWLWGDVQGLEDDTELPRPMPEANAAAPNPAPIDDDLPGMDFNDDMEDFEGIFELLGLRGPIIGLFQNSLFSLILIFATIVAAVWFPYLWGKMVLLIVGGSSLENLLRMPFELAGATADAILDLCLGGVGFVGLIVLRIVRYIFGLVFFWAPPNQINPPALDELATSAQTLFLDSANRLLDFAGLLAGDSDYLRLSISSHAALRSIETGISSLSHSSVDMLCSTYDHSLNFDTSNLFSVPVDMTKQAVASASSLTTFVTREVHSLMADLSTLFVFDYQRRFNAFSAASKRELGTSDPSLTYWSARDRTIAIVAGYLAFVALGGLYLCRAQKRFLTSSPQGRKVERTIYQVLRQAGGVLKVMVIIGIEMIVFPLYCGTLLDFALLPLFENATVASRVVYAMESPWTSGFVHWFTGTSYMFHFALFVSMCRKILRSGVLHFIRDPDDPSNHPVRDVLERNVTTQLRKIIFSAFVYGGLVLVCLGGVTWTLSLGSGYVLPLRSGHSSSLLETIFDLVVFGFLTPIILDRVHPNDSLHQIYVWWFRTSARALRLSSFLLGESGSRDQKPSRLPWPLSVASSYFATGRHVFAPASDHVRLAKGEPVFKDVGPDGKMSAKHAALLHSSAASPNGRAGNRDNNNGNSSNSRSDYKKVYIPPLFRARISIFVTWLWLFTVAAGMTVSVLPLLWGRFWLRLASGRNPKDINDIYSFITGLYTFGGVGYAVNWCHKNRHRLLPLLRITPTVSATFNLVRDALSFMYVYMALVVVFPLVITTLFEVYFLLPIHILLRPSDTHSIHLIQNWTLGILYVRLLYGLVISLPDASFSRAVNAIFANGWYRPRAVLATKTIIFPLSLVCAAMALFPYLFSVLINRTVLRDADPAMHTLVCRLVYPATALIWINVAIGMASRSYFERWQQSVIDEIYVVRERLHNIGETRVDVRMSTDSEVQPL